MDTFSINQLAALAGISVRTLRHYDQIGLLKPSDRAESGYRYYGQKELLRLQQILLYKELDFSLAQIHNILDDPDFDVVDALRSHRKELQSRSDRLLRLMKTIEETIVQLENRTTKMNYDDLYEGFSKEKAQAYEKEASEKWGKKIVQESHERLLSLDKKEWEAMKQKGEDINKKLAALMDLSPSDPNVQDLIRRHYALMGKHFNITPDIYKNMGVMYTEDERFKSYYDVYRMDLAFFLKDAILIFCK